MRICDRCGPDNPTPGPVGLLIKGTEEHVDLCVSCEADVREFIKTPKKKPATRGPKPKKK